MRTLAYDSLMTDKIKPGYKKTLYFPLNLVVNLKLLVKNVKT